MSDEKVQNYAEFTRRLAAFLVDAVILIGVVSVTVFLPGTLLVFFGKPDAPVLGSTYVFATVFFLLYFTLMESSAKQATIGKKLVGMTVTDMKGERISLRHALVRTVGKSIPLLFFVLFAEIISPVVQFFENAGLLILIPILLAGLWYLPMWFNPGKQATHDMMAGTLVLTS